MRELSFGRRPAGRGLQVLAFAAAALALCAAPRNADAGQYKDGKKGFQFNSPDKWKQLPLSPDEKFVAASFAHDREFEWSDDKKSIYDRHRPQIDVVILPKSETEKKAGVKAEKDEEGNIAISMNRVVYKDFKDYLEQTSQRYGGFYISDEHETKVGNYKVMVYEVTIDKLANAPRKRWGWAFYTDEAIYGITADSLIKYEEKVRPEIEAAFRSFKIIPHTEALGNTTTGDSADVVIKTGGKKLTPEEKAKEREDAFNAYLLRAKELIPEGWKIRESKNYVAFTHCDDKFTKEILDHSEALRGWLDETLGFLGENVPGRTILRICADENERNALYKTGGWTSRKFEIFTHKDREGTVDSRLWALNQGLFSRWLNQKNESLSWRLPVWVDYGLRDAITNAKSKGKKLEFKNSAQENERLATTRRAGNLITGRDFMTKGVEELSKCNEVRLQAQCFSMFLVQGGAQRNPKYKNILSDYLKSFVAMLKEEDGKSSAPSDNSPEPTSEEEESAAYAARANKWKEEERRVLDALIEKTFPGWTDKDWGSFNNSYAKELGE